MKTAYTPRPYQRERIDIASQMLLDRVNAAIVLPTGLGKTLTALWVCDRVMDSRPGEILWLVDRKPLVSQTQAKAVETQIPVNVKTIQGLNARDKRIIRGDYSMIVLDEAHKFLTEKRLDLIRESQTPCLLLTATPTTGDGRHIRLLGVEDYVGGVYTLGQAIQDEWLCDCMVERVELRSLDLREVRRGRNDFDAGELATAMNEESVNEEVVRRWRNRAWQEGRPQISNFFCVDTAHAEAIADEVNRQCGPNVCVPIHSKLADSLDRIERFRSGEFRVAASVMMIAEGFDYPALRCGILARPTQSVRLLVQMLGRFLRPHESKPHAWILDCDGAYETLDLNRIYDIVEPPGAAEPAVCEGGMGDDDEDDGIPMLSHIVSRVRMVDLFRRQCAEQRTMPWSMADGRYALPLFVGGRPSQWLVVAASKFDPEKAAVALLYYASGYARCDTLERAVDEPDAFRIAEDWVRHRHLPPAWQNEVPDIDVRDGVRRWYKDRGPPSEAMSAKLADAGYDVPKQHGLAVRLTRRLYARGDLS